MADWPSQLPQLITNYRAKSADALSMKFLLIWLTGDVANLSGSCPSQYLPAVDGHTSSIHPKLPPQSTH